MEKYFISDDVLCFTQENDTDILIIEKNKKYVIKGNSLKY